MFDLLFVADEPVWATVICLLNPHLVAETSTTGSDFDEPERLFESTITIWAVQRGSVQSE